MIRIMINAGQLASRFLVLFMMIFLPVCTWSQACIKPSIYLHTDRSIYQLHNQVFFKAYIFDQYSPDTQSTVLCLELIARNGKKVSLSFFPIYNGISFGSFPLDFSGEPGFYLIRASIKNSKGESPEYIKPVYLTDGKELIDIKLTQGEADSVPHLQLFPAGGQISEGVVNKVYFRVTNKSGFPINATGIVINDAGDTLTNLATEWQGLGEFDFIPQKNHHYQCRITTTAGTTRLFPIGSIAKEGITVSGNQSADDFIFRVNIPESLIGNNQAQARGFVNGTEIFRKPIQMRSAVSAFKVPVSELPACTLDFTLENTEGKLLYKSAYFVNGTQAAEKTELSSSLIRTDSGMNIVNLKWPDSIKGSISVSITELDETNHLPDGNIFSSLLLNNDSRVFFPDEKDGMMNTAPERSIALMLGSRNNKEWAANQPETKTKLACFNADTNFISAQGRILDKASGRPVANEEFKVIFSENDSSGVSIFPMKTDANGRFVIPGLVYEGTGTFRYQMNKNRGEVYAEIDTFMAKGIDPSFNELFSSLESTAIRRNTSNHGAAPAVTADTKADSQTTLKEVTVNANIGRPVDRVNKKYARGLFSSMLFARTLDFISDPPTTGGNIMEYLAGRINGLMINPSTFEVQALRGAVKVFLNEQETGVNFLMSIRPSDVALVKYFPPGNAPLPGIGTAGVLAIYTRKYDDDNINNNAKFSGIFKLQGFGKSSGFNPASGGATLYWDPFVVLDGTKNSNEFRFQRSRSDRPILISVAGATTEGKIIWIQRILK